MVDDKISIICAIAHLETNIGRIEAQEERLKQHINRLTDYMVIGTRREEELFDLFAATQFAGQLDEHIT